MFADRRNFAVLLLSVVAVLVAGVGSANAVVSISPSAASAPLLWGQASSGGSYDTNVAPTFTVSGETGSVAWTTTYGSCVVSGTNSSTCLYRAPIEYVPSWTDTVVASDGTSSSTATVNFQFFNGLNEYFVHWARQSYYNGSWYTRTSKPETLLETADTNDMNNGSDELLIYNTTVSSTDEAWIIGNDQGDLYTPVIAGSAINRPSWTADGRTMIMATNERCNSVQYCSNGNGTVFFYFMDANGRNLRFPLNLTNYAEPVFSDSNPAIAYFTNNGTNLYSYNMNTETPTLIMDLTSISSSTSISLIGPESDGFLWLREANALCNASSTGSFTCFDGTSYYQTTPPKLYLLNTSGCEPTPSLNCATVLDQFGVNLGLSTLLGHNQANEYHFHDIYDERGTSFSYPSNTSAASLVFNYGPAGDVGESLWFHCTPPVTSSTCSFWSPDPQTTNRSYWSHPADDSTGQFVAYSGNENCNVSYLPTSTTCNNLSTDHEWLWKISDSDTSKIAFGELTNAGAGHNAWDGNDYNYLAYDGYSPLAGCPVTGTLGHWCLASVRTDGSASTVGIDFGPRDMTNSLSYTPSIISGPSQSPDGTKIVEPMWHSFSNGLHNYLNLLVAHYPETPVNLSATSASSASLQWFAPAIAAEAEKFNIYRQPGCSGSWSYLASVNAVWGQTSAYTYTDGTVISGNTYCYGVTMQEWSGLESRTLSNLVSITDSSGSFSHNDAFAGSGTFGFMTAPSTPSSTSVAVTQLPAPSGINVGTESVLGTGGTLADGYYFFKVRYCTGTNNDQCKVATSAQTVHVAQGTGTSQISFGTVSEQVGQTADQIYASYSATNSDPGDASRFLQTCSGVSSTVILTYNIATQNRSLSCTITSFATSTQALPADSSAAPVLKTISWTDSASTLRYVNVYYADGTAPAISNGLAAAQKYLIASIPTPDHQYADWEFNPDTTNYYGLIAVDRQGNASAPVCINANTNGIVACN